MVLLGLSVLATLVLSYFAISTVSVLAHWVSIALALGIGAYVTYTLVENQFYGLVSFDSDVFEFLTALPIGSVTGFVSFRLIENVFASVGFVSALIISLVVSASIIFSPQLVAGILKSLFEFVYALLEER